MMSGKLFRSLFRKNISKNFRINSIFLLLLLLLPALLFAGEWSGDNAFRVTAPGVPERGIVGEKARRDSSVEVAVALARARVVEELAWVMNEDGLDDAADIPAYRNAVFSVFREAILAGRVVDVRYGEDEECSIVFEITFPGLRARLAELRKTLKPPKTDSDGVVEDEVYRSLREK
jgi:hypothetical protein